MRLENIDESNAVYPAPLDTIHDLHRIFDTFARKTVFECDGKRFDGKYIVVPSFYQALVIPVDEVPDRFYEEFKLGSRSLKDAVIYIEEGKKYYLLIDKVMNKAVKKSEAKVLTKPTLTKTSMPTQSTSSNEITHLEAKPTTTTSSTTNYTKYTGSSKSASTPMVLSIVATLALLIAFIIMLSAKASIAYHLVHNGETVSHQIYTSLYMSSNFGGFMIFLFVVNMIASIVIPFLKDKHPKSVFGGIGLIILDIVMLIGYFAAKSKMEGYSPSITVSTYYPVVDSFEMGGGFAAGVVFLLGAIVMHLIATIINIKEEVSY